MRDGTSRVNPVFFKDERHDLTINILENTTIKVPRETQNEWGCHKPSTHTCHEGEIL
jgi:hypothetical protein